MISRDIEDKARNKKPEIDMSMDFKEQPKSNQSWTRVTNEYNKKGGNVYTEQEEEKTWANSQNFKY